MDENNVIIPTDDLDTLEQEMDSWIRLPYKLRKLSNDACMQKYNCTVNDLYNSLKEKILRVKDYENTDSSNLVQVKESPEELDWGYGEDLGYRLSISRQLQLNPLIVIIDPDCSEQELDNRYASYLKLSQKFKTYSNGYSIQLWGYNVPNMYDKVKARLETGEAYLDADSNNTVEEAFIPLENRMISNIASCVEHKSVYDGLKESNDPIDRAYAEKQLKPLNVSIPYAGPWFTIQEMEDMGIHFKQSDISMYVYNVKRALESDNESAVLNLGWIPCIPISEKNLKLARQRQMNWFAENFIKVYEASDVASAEVIPENYVPLFIAVNEPIPASEELMNNASDRFNINHYTSFGIFPDDTFNSIYILDGEITLEHIPYEYFEVITFFIPTSVYDKIMTNIKDTKYEDIINTEYYRYILNSRPNVDRTNEKLIYALIGHTLMKIANEENFYDKQSPNYVLKGFYRLFKGYKDQFDKDRVRETAKVIANNMK